jgi:hypothetical protein
VPLQTVRSGDAAAGDSQGDAPAAKILAIRANWKIDLAAPGRTGIVFLLIAINLGGSLASPVRASFFTTILFSIAEFPTEYPCSEDRPVESSLRNALLPDAQPGRTGRSNNSNRW